MSQTQTESNLPLAALEQVLASVGRPLDSGDVVSFTDTDPVLPTPFRVATAGAAAIAACGLAVSDLWSLRHGRRQAIWVQLRAAAAAMRSERYLERPDEPLASLWDPISGFYATRDGQWIQLHCNFPHHRDGVLAYLQCEATRAAVATAIQALDGERLEDALTGRGLCAALVRSSSIWAAHAQSAAVDELPLLEVLKIGESPPEPLPAASRPLSGVRVLDLTRVLAGPTCGRTLAEHGADVMRIDSPKLPHIPRLVMDTGHGKLSARLDLNDAGDAATLCALIEKTDVFTQAYRPGSLARRGYSPEALTRLRPGIVCVALSAYGHRGPWAERRGFDTLVQCATGIVDEQSRTLPPKHLPGSVLDYTTGYLAAFGAMVALARRAERGGSYLVRVSLCQTAHWLKRLGVVADEPDPRLRPDQSAADVADFITESQTPCGRLVYMKPALELSETPPYWARPVVPLGTHAPVWPEDN